MPLLNLYEFQWFTAIYILNVVLIYYKIFFPFVTFLSLAI